MIKVIYTPNHTYFTGYDSAFVAFMEETLPMYVEPEIIKDFKKINSTPCFDWDFFYIKCDGVIKVYSGLAKYIVCAYGIHNFDIHSEQDKYSYSDQKIPEVLYDHQGRIVSACFRHSRGVIKSPTGSGKSYVIADLCRRLVNDDLNVLVTVPTIDLLNQLTVDFNTYMTSPYKVGRIGGGFKEPARLTIGIPNSLVKDEWVDYLGMVDALIADEVHTTANATYSVIARRMDKRRVSYGLSATPWTNDWSHYLIQGIFGPSFIEIEESEMIRNEIIMEPEFKYYPAPAAYIPPRLAKDCANISNLSNLYRFKVLNEAYEYVISNNTGRNRLICELAKERINEDVGPIIIIVNKIKGKNGKQAHGEVLQSMLAKKGIDLPLIAGYIGKKKRAGIINDLKEENIKGCIAGPKILSAGISIPSLSTILLAGGGKSDSEFIQRVGRLLRKKEGKERPVVIDFNDPQYWFAKHSRSRLETAEEVYGSDNITII